MGKYTSSEVKGEDLKKPPRTRSLCAENPSPPANYTIPYVDPPLIDLGPHLLEHALLPCLEELPALHPMFVAVPAACRATRELRWDPMFDTIFRKRWPALYDHVCGEGPQAPMRQMYMQVLWGLMKFDCQALLLPKSSKKFDGSLKFASVQYIPRVGAAVLDDAVQVPIRIQCQHLGNTVNTCLSILCPAALACVQWACGPLVSCGPPQGQLTGQCTGGRPCRRLGCGVAVYQPEAQNHTREGQIWAPC